MNSDFSCDFGPFDSAIWLNCSHQGPLPKVAVTKLEEAISWKVAPHNLTQERFNQVPLRLKEALGKLVHVSPDEIILGNSASYGLHLIANGMNWHDGDEVVLVKGDFPSDILPWLGLRERGVRVRFIKPKAQTVSAEELNAAFTPATKLFCCTWVHSFTGGAIDIAAIGEACHKHNVLFVMNCSQGLGARLLDVSQMPVDAISCVGFKWLCAPYGTGFCWMRPKLLDSIHYNQAYWLSMQTAQELESDSDEPPVIKKNGARTYDVFGTANFFNFVPWTASIEYLLNAGLETIQTYDQLLISHLIDRLDKKKFYFISPEEGLSRSTLVVFSSHDRTKNARVYELLKSKNIHIAFRRGNLRISPHLYNTLEQIDQVATVLNSG